MEVSEAPNLNLPAKSSVLARTGKVIAIFLSVIDAFYLTLGFAPYLLLSYAFYLSAIYKPKEATFYVIIASLSYILVSYQSAVAERNAQKLVEAISWYKDVNKKYPDTLKQLAPAYIDSIPYAKHTIIPTQYRLTMLKGHLLLSYNARFIKMDYYFGDRSWHTSSIFSTQDYQP